MQCITRGQCSENCLSTSGNTVLLNCAVGTGLFPKASLSLRAYFFWPFHWDHSADGKEVEEDCPYQGIMFSVIPDPLWYFSTIRNLLWCPRDSSPLENVKTPHNSKQTSTSFKEISWKTRSELSKDDYASCALQEPHLSFNVDMDTCNPNSWILWSPMEITLLSLSESARLFRHNFIWHNFLELSGRYL